MGKLKLYKNMGKRIDYKVSIWRSAELEEDVNIEDLKELLTEGHLSDILDSTMIESDDILYDTEEIVHPEDNNNYHTVELYDEDNKIVWQNDI